MRITNTIKRRRNRNNYFCNQKEMKETDFCKDMDEEGRRGTAKETTVIEKELRIVE